MDTWNFRIKTTLEPGISLSDNDTERVLFGKGDIKVILTLPLKSKVPNGGYLVIKGVGYPDETTAQNEAIRWRTAVTKSFLAHGIGTDFGDGLWNGGMSKYALDSVNNGQEVVVMNDRMGIMTYPGKKPTSFVSGHVTAYSSPKLDMFVKSVPVEYQTCSNYTERLYEAYNAYSASFFVEEPSARLLLLVSSLEIITERVKRSEKIRNILKKTVSDVTNLGFPREDNERILSGLRDLEKESIGESVVKLIDSKVSSNDARSDIDIFKKAYKLRSDILHGNLPKKERLEISSTAAELGTLSAKIIYKCFDTK